MALEDAVQFGPVAHRLFLPKTRTSFVAVTYSLVHKGVNCYILSRFGGLLAFRVQRFDAVFSQEYE